MTTEFRTESEIVGPYAPVDEFIYDAWTPLDYKNTTVRRSGKASQVAPDWTGEHKRRLNAYNILRAYLANRAASLLPGNDADASTRRDQHREYGDPAVIVATVRAAVLGDDVEITVEGAQDYDPDSLDADPEQAEARAALDLQEWIQEWADNERFLLKLIENEDMAQGLGDCVWSLGYSKKKGRTRVRIWDPSFYYPVLGDGANEDDFPNRVHIAWQMPDDPADPMKRIRIRRITWELGPILPQLDDDGIPLMDENGVRLQDGDSRTEDGRITRRYPWAPDEPSDVTCYLTDAIWTIDRGRKPASVDDFSEQRAEYQADEDGLLKRRDIRCDFIPVVHVPNTPAQLDHFGTAVLTRILQLLDDLAATDTDLQGASATTGTPPVGVTGVSTRGHNAMTYRPGQVWDLGQNGRLQTLDTSRSLDALLKYEESLLDRLSVNSRTPKALLGRIKPSEVPSGYALRLQFGPLERLVKEMRMVREEKYPLLFKFAWRLALAAGQEGVPQTYVPTRLAFGKFMPADTSGTVEAVGKLLATKPPAISLETAVTLLVEAGMPIEDAQEEVRRIESRDFEGANRLLDATGDENQVDDYLGIETAVTLPEAPPVALPPTPPPPEEEVE